MKKPYDVTIRHPTCPTAVAAAAKTQLITVARADREKNVHHHVDVESNQSHIEPALRSAPDFHSFSCETYGGLHEYAAQLVKDISIIAQDRPTVFTTYEIRSGLFASVGCAIQRYNARMILENIHQSAKPAAATAPSYHAPSHVALVPLSSHPPPHRTFMHSSRVNVNNIRPADSISSQTISVTDQIDRDDESVQLLSK